MKQIIIILLLVLGINLTIVSQSKAHISNMHLQYKVLKISPAQQKELGNLVNFYKRLTKKYCDLCQLGTQTHYTHRTDAEFQYLIRQAQHKLDATIHAIKTLYERIGMKHQQVVDEEKKLRAVFYYWI